MDEELGDPTLQGQPVGITGHMPIERRGTPSRRPLIGLCLREPAAVLAIAQRLGSVDLSSVSSTSVLTEVMKNAAALCFFAAAGRELALSDAVGD